MGLPKLFFDNRFADAAPVASDTDPGNFAAANIADARKYTWYKPLTLPATIRVNCGSVKAADFALFCGHDLFTQGASVAIHGSTDDFVTSDVEVVAPFAPTSDDPFLLEFASANYQYWGLVITGTTMPSLAIVMIGAAFVMPKNISAGFDPVGRTIIGQSNNNENGQPLGNIIDFEQRKQTLTFANVSYAWAHTTWKDAWESYLRSSPFVLAWDSVNYPADLALVTVGDNFATPHKPGGLCDLTFDINGVV